MCIASSEAVVAIGVETHELVPKLCTRSTLKSATGYCSSVLLGNSSHLKNSRFKFSVEYARRSFDVLFQLGPKEFEKVISKQIRQYIQVLVQF
jgi:hypothetical protein